MKFGFDWPCYFRGDLLKIADDGQQTDGRRRMPLLKFHLLGLVSYNVIFKFSIIVLCPELQYFLKIKLRKTLVKVIDFSALN